LPRCGADIRPRDYPSIAALSAYACAVQRDDPFPRDAFVALIRRIPAYARLAWSLARDPRVSRTRRVAVMAAAAYLVSPIDLVPGFIPVLGQLDDLVVALTAIRVALGGLPAEVRAERLATVELDQTDLDDDLRTTGAIAAWIARASLRAAGRVATATARSGLALGRRAIHAARRH
jgi:uncharacterized membrane protein YkvA (DUF1232 family)